MSGAGSPAYGSDALGGVVSFYTRRPELSANAQGLFSGQAFTRYATANDGKTAHLTLNYGRQQFAVLTAATVSRFGDLRIGRTGRRASDAAWGLRPFYQGREGEADVALPNKHPLVQPNSGYDQADGLVKVLWQPSAAWSHTLNLQGSTSADVPRSDRLSEVRNGLPRFGEWYYGPQRRLLAAWQVHHEQERTSADITAAFQHIEESRHDRRWNTPWRNNRFERVRAASVNADFRRDLGAWRLLYGSELIYNQVRSTAQATQISTGEQRPLDTRYPDGGSSVRTGAVYLTAERPLAKGFHATAGLRLTTNALTARFRDTAFFHFPFRDVTQRQTALSGQAGLTWTGPRGWWAAVRGASGFRSPNVDDLAKVFESVPGRLVLPNPDLRPERTWNAEASVRKQFGWLLEVRVTGWHTWYQNAIGLQVGQYAGQDSLLYQGQPSQVLRSANTQRARLVGVTVGAVLNLTAALDLRSTLSWTRGRFQTDSGAYPLDHIPPLYGRTGLRLVRSKLEAEAYAFYNGWKRVADYNLIGEDNFQYATPDGTPAWYTLNARVGWQAWRHLYVQAALENVLDRHYRVFASGISAPGRNLVLTVRASW